MQPLNQLATLYRTIQEAMIDMENMMQLMNVEEEIKDVSEASIINSDKYLIKGHALRHYKTFYIILSTNFEEQRVVF